VKRVLLLAVVFATVIDGAAAEGSIPYLGPYTCTLTSDAGFFTAVESLQPNGKGSYLGGSQTVYGVDNNKPSQGCSYTLGDSSSYTVNSNGSVSETLNWTPSTTNPASCPRSYQDKATILLTVIGSYFIDNNLANLGAPGVGNCLY
jgi:hypothetical protein